MSKYHVVDPRCVECETSLIGQEALMIRPVQFYGEVEVAQSSGLPYRYRMTSKVSFYCVHCAGCFRRFQAEDGRKTIPGQDAVGEKNYNQEDS